MVEDYFRRVKVTAHHLGLGLPDDLYSESDEEVLPWTRTWRANQSVEPPELFLLSHPILVVRRCAVWPGIRFTGYLVVLQFAAASWPRHTAVAGQSRARLQIVGRWLAGRARRCGLRPIPDGGNLLQEIAKLLHL